MTRDQAQRILELAIKPVLVPADQAVASYGPAVTAAISHVEEIDEWSHRAQMELSLVFEVEWTGDPELDLETLDRIAESWSARAPELESLLEMSLTWGSLVGEELLGAVGGAWVFRTDPLHHSVRFLSRGVEIFPMHAVLARLLAKAESAVRLTQMYQQLVEYLTGG